MFLRAKNLEKSYFSKDMKSKDTIIKDLNLSVNKGERVLIYGPSGAGKSTLLHMLGALDIPTNGKIYFDDQELICNKDTVADIRNKKFGFIFQFHYLMSGFTVLENLLLAGAFSNLSKTDLKEKAVSLIDRIGLLKRINGLPSQLSGGERQRVAVLRALINDPEIIFADEPTGNLDNENRIKVYELLQNFLDENNKTLVIVSHDEDVGLNNLRKIKMIDGVLI